MSKNYWAKDEYHISENKVWKRKREGSVGVRMLDLLTFKEEKYYVLYEACAQSSTRLYLVNSKRDVVMEHRETYYRIPMMVAYKMLLKFIEEMK